MQALTRRPRPASGRARVVALPRPLAHLTLAVVGADHDIRRRVHRALTRDGIAARVDDAGETRLCRDAVPRRPDVVLLDGADDARLAEAARIRRALAGVPVVVAVETAGDCNVRRLLEAGVDGVVLADQLEETIGFVVRAVCAGHVALPRAMRHAIDPPVLSDRDRAILALVVAGLSNAEIAERQYLARSTVAGRLTRIFGKLGVVSRAEAIALVLGADESLRDHLAPPPPPLAIADARGRP